jgi:hypothetical protein
MAISCSSQTMDVFFNHGLLITRREESWNQIELDKLESKGDFIIAYQQGFMTQVLDINELFEKNLQRYAFTPKAITKPILKGDQKKIKFLAFADPGGKVGTHVVPQGNYAFKQENIALKDPQLAKEVNLYLKKSGFNVITDESNLFNEVGKDGDLVIAAEIMSYHRNTKGTKGFKIGTALKWSLFDPSEKKVLLSVLTGGYNDAGIAMGETEAFSLASIDALQSLICNPDFLQLIVSDFSSSKSANSNFDKIIIPSFVSKGVDENSNYIETSIKSTVTIKRKDGGHGSGFFLSSNGYLLTNEHVIAGSESCEALLSNGISLPLEVIRSDKKRDIALLKIPGSGYPPLPLDTSYIKGKIGSDIVAIGTPKDIDLGQTVTKGIISGLRDFEGQIFIQTDASINPGNSGGPLINKKGQVVGIVTSKNMNAEGIAYAIPVMDALKKLNIELK